MSVITTKLIEQAMKACVLGGIEILKVYESTIDVSYKDDKSPLTEADKRAHNAIVAILEQNSIPILSEEGKHDAYADRKDWELLWVVDPLDGTKEFIKRNGEFTVNIALVQNGAPIMGVIFVPVQNQLYIGAEGVGAFRMADIKTVEQVENWEKVKAKADAIPEKQERAFTMVGSRSHMSDETMAYFENIKKEHPNAEVISKGSSLKICMVAEGSADVYPRFAPTMEWDTAAGHGIAKYAGFEVLHPEKGTPLEYNKEDLLNPWFIVQKAE